MIDVILIVIILLIAASTGMYVYKAKKRGEHCIGCPHAKKCSEKSCNCTNSFGDTD